MPENLEFTSNGKRYSLNKQGIIRKMNGVSPGKIHTHAVDIGGVLYPVKEAYAYVLGRDILDFHTQEARNNFKRVGFTLRRVTA